MARRREIDPRFFRHRKLYEADRDTGLPCRIAFAGLWVVADREGRFRWDADDLKLFILPYDPVDFDAVLTALVERGFIRRYAVGDRQFGDLPTFLEHQRPHPREAKSRLPSHPDGSIARQRLDPSSQRHANGSPGSEKSVGPSGPSDPQAFQAFGPSSLQHPAAGGQPIAYLTRCVLALNAGLQDNPAIGSQRREIATSEQQGRVTWEADGIPIGLVERVVRGAAAKFIPSRRSSQPNSLRYFDEAVRRAWELEQQPAAVDPITQAARDLVASGKYAS